MWDLYRKQVALRRISPLVIRYSPVQLIFFQPVLHEHSVIDQRHYTALGTGSVVI
jgi:hypothetical protein